MKYDFTPRGVCSRGIHIDLDGETIRSGPLRRRLQRQYAGRRRALAAGMNATLR